MLPSCALLSRGFFRFFRPPAPKILMCSKQEENAFLHAESRSVTFPLDDRTQSVMNLMRNVHANFDDFVGISAPQVGHHLRIILIEISREIYLTDNTAKEVVPLHFLINPTLKPIKKFGKSLDWESCYSIPDMVGEVLRYNCIEYTAYNIEGKIMKGVVRGLHARLLQHEVGHLDGKLYNDHINQARFITKEKFLEIMNQRDSGFRNKR